MLLVGAALKRLFRGKRLERGYLFVASFGCAPTFAYARKKKSIGNELYRFNVWRLRITLLWNVVLTYIVIDYVDSNKLPHSLNWESIPSPFGRATPSLSLLILKGFCFTIILFLLMRHRSIRTNSIICVFTTEQTQGGEGMSTIFWGYMDQRFEQLK